MKKRIPLILSIVFFITFLSVVSIYIYINSSSIDFKTVYGDKSNLGNFEIVLFKDKDIYEEDMVINSKSTKNLNTINERYYNGIDVLKDKKFFRGIYPTNNTFFENDEVMVNVNVKYDSVVPKLEVRLKDKKENIYEFFEVKTEEFIKTSNIDKVSYKEGKINIIFNGSNGLIFGEIPLNEKELNLVGNLNLGDKLNINKEDFNVILVENEFASLEKHDLNKAYYRVNRIVTDINEVNYIDGTIVEVNSDTREFNVYNVDEKTLKDFNNFEGEGDIIGDVFKAYGKIYLTKTCNNKTSAIVFDTEKKDFVLYKDIVENERLERLGVNISSIGTFIIDKDKLIINFIDYNEKEQKNSRYIAVIDIPSKNPIYIGEIVTGYLGSIEIIGGN